MIALKEWIQDKPIKGLLVHLPKIADREETIVALLFDPIEQPRNCIVLFSAVGKSYEDIPYSCIELELPDQQALEEYVDYYLAHNYVEACTDDWWVPEAEIYFSM